MTALYRALDAAAGENQRLTEVLVAENASLGTTNGGSVFASGELV